VTLGALADVVVSFALGLASLGAAGVFGLATLATLSEESSSVSGPGVAACRVTVCGAAPAFLFFVLGFFCICLLRSGVPTQRTDTQTFNRRLAKCETATQLWQQLYYRARDDGVFIDGKTELIPIGQMHGFLTAD
jgi:hypothetical protein